jgi:hypothetical protein
MSIQQFPGGYIRDGVAYRFDEDAAWYRAREFGIAAQAREEQRQRDVLEAKRIYTERVHNFVSNLTKEEFRLAELTIMERRLKLEVAAMKRRKQHE